MEEERSADEGLLVQTKAGASRHTLGRKLASSWITDTVLTFQGRRVPGPAPRTAFSRVTQEATGHLGPERGPEGSG